MGHRLPARRAGVAARVLALSLALMVVRYRPAFSDPGDIFSVSAPLITQPPQASAAIADGDAAVASQTGALTYHFAVKTPPGRGKASPALSISYSSQAPLFGGLAAGWTLSGVPTVSEDTSDGRLGATSPRYQSSLSGDRPLIEVLEFGSTHWRAQNDSSWVRYEKAVNGVWIARTTDGSTYTFGQQDHANGDANATPPSAPCTTFSWGNAPLTHFEDEFGNAVDYMWEAGASGECRLKAITWGQNVAAGVGYFAALELDYETSPTCGGVEVGSQTSYRTGTKIVTGASQLHAIRAAAFAPYAAATASVTTHPIPATPDHTRTITLHYSSYTPGCDRNFAPHRQLTSIDETAIVGSDTMTLVSLTPAVEFEYGSPDQTYQLQSSTALTPWSGPNGPSNNLGWGRRYPSGDGRWPTVEAMMIDIDGDGLVDRLQSEPVMAGGVSVVSCRARWYRNTGHSFEAQNYIEMPTLKWATESTKTGAAKYDGGAAAGVNPAGAKEGCSLNYQETAYVNSQSYGGDLDCPPYSGGFVQCPNSGYCDGTGGTNATGDDCGSQPNLAGDSVFAWRWFDVNGDGKPDLVGSPTKGGLTRYNLQQGNLLQQDPVTLQLTPPPSEPPLLGFFQPCPTTPFTSHVPTPYGMCAGMYPWFVYLNHNGTFGRPRHTCSNTIEYDPNCVDEGNFYGPAPDAMLYQPIPLEPESADSSITSNPASDVQGVLDLDGDGYADGVRADGASSWNVYRNDTLGYGQLMPQTGASPYSFPTGLNYWVSRTDVLPGTRPPTGSHGLTDLNGDGLADHWSTDTAGSATADVHLNDGVQFRTTDGLSTARPATDAVPGTCPLSSSSNCNSGNPSYFTCEGSRTDGRRTLDVDGDGRVDIVTQQGTNWPTVAINEGGVFGTPRVMTFNPSDGVQSTIARRMLALTSVAGSTCVDQIGEHASFTWEIRSDMVDLDGDGIPEGIDFGSSHAPSSMSVFKNTNTPWQPRLLTSIYNHRGAVSTITYSTLNGAAVESHPETGNAVPTTQFVVASISTQDTLANTTSPTSYKYISPVYNMDPTTKRYAFRGFERVEITSPSTAKTIQVFGYAPDFSGRLEKTLVMPKLMEQAVPNEVRSVDLTHWDAFPLFNGALTTFHATRSDHWTCKNGQDEDACTANTDTRTTTVSTLEAIADNVYGSAQCSLTEAPFCLLWQEKTSRLQTSESQADGDRSTTTTFALAANATNYRLRPLLTTRQVQQGGVMVTFATSENVWDTNYLVVRDSIVTTDGSGTNNQAITHRAYDMDTGNVLKIWKPEQWSCTLTDDPTPVCASSSGGSPNESTNTKYTSFAYDARKLFVATETGVPIDGAQWQDVRDYTWEYGTGTKVETLGPNIPPCAFPIPHVCPEGWPEKEDHQIRVDGFGRMIERYESGGGWADNYSLYKIEMNTYVDGPAVSVVHQSAIDIGDYTPMRYRKEKTELDGHGRPIKKTVAVGSNFGEAPADEVTVFSYRDDGTLATVEVPSPIANDESRVTYSYVFDSLGRPSEMQRPDGSDEATKSGVRFSYNGLQHKTAEWVGSSNGNAGESQTTTDAFGRLLQVDERRSATEVSTTHYCYGADDNVSQIVDPEGVVTRLFHDFAGRRIGISRLTAKTPNAACPPPTPSAPTSGIGTWLYAYDLNGNLRSETTPCTGLACSNSVTTTAYDEHDRPASKTIAHRDLTNDDIALFGDAEMFYYDANYNGADRLYGWWTFAGTAVLQLNQHNWSAQGQDQWADHGDTVAGVDLPSLYVFKRFYPSGLMVDMFPGDGVDGEQTCLNNSNVYYGYDDRGLPWYVGINPCVYQAPGEGYSAVMNERNVAGLVTRQFNVDGSITGVPIQSLWTYDVLGRVTDQAVDQNTTHDPVVHQHLTYNGNDDPATLEHHLGANQKTFTFGYDYRHQLLTAHENDPSYFSATYTYGTAGRFQEVNESGSPHAGGNVVQRDYQYQYNGTDPEQVTALTTTGNSEPSLSYAYDAAGNQTMRCSGTISSGACTPTSTTTGESISFLYDGKDQLRRATKRNGAGSIVGIEEYWYDETGARTHVARRDASNAVTEIVSFIENSEWHHDPATGAITRAFGGITLGGQIVARQDRSSTSAPSTLEYQFYGLANNTIAAVDQSTGTINASFSYAPFGEIIEATNGGGSSAGIDEHLRRMNDKQVDLFDDLAYYGARYYDRTSMTWTQGDPLYRFAPDSAWAEPRRSSLYTFSGNNPLRYLDPDGRYPISIRDVGRALDAALEDASVIVAEAMPVVGAAVVTYEAGMAAGKYEQRIQTGLQSTQAAYDLVDNAWDNYLASLPSDMDTHITTPVEVDSRPLLMPDRDRITPPSWVINEGHRPADNESSQDFAKRILDDKYGKGNWKKGGGSEYSSIEKWARRVVRAGGVLGAMKNLMKKSDPSSKKFAPADTNKDGNVSDEEEAAYMKSIN